MTVQELIEQLERLPPDALVVRVDFEWGEVPLYDEALDFVGGPAPKVIIR